MNEELRKALARMESAMRCQTPQRIDEMGERTTAKMIHAWADTLKALLERPQGEAVAWVRTLNGEIDWSEDCMGDSAEQVLMNYEYKNSPDMEPDDRYGAIPLYLHPQPQAKVPEGWKLVPTKVTQRMAEAGASIDGRLSVFKAADIYRAMLNAAGETSDGK